MTTPRLSSLLFGLLLSLTAAAQQFHTMPQVPDTLTERRDKARWFVTHYWDTADFRHATPQSVEQAFVDYITILQVAPECAFVQFPDSAAFIDLADKYLRDPESPLHSMAYYDRYVRMHLHDSLPDIPLRTARGQVRGLRRLIANQPDSVTLLLYDPECEECVAEIKQLAEAKTPCVVAVNMGSGRLQLPPHWIACRPAGNSIYRLLPFRRLPFKVTI